MAKIIPSPEDFLKVEREHGNEPPAEKYRLAQASALIRLFDTDEALVEAVKSGQLSVEESQEIRRQLGIGTRKRGIAGSHE